MGRLDAAPGVAGARRRRGLRAPAATPRRRGWGRRAAARRLRAAAGGGGGVDGAGGAGDRVDENRRPRAGGGHPSHRHGADGGDGAAPVRVGEPDVVEVRGSTSAIALERPRPPRKPSGPAPRRSGPDGSPRARGHGPRRGPVRVRAAAPTEAQRAPRCRGHVLGARRAAPGPPRRRAASQRPARGRDVVPRGRGDGLPDAQDRRAAAARRGAAREDPGRGADGLGRGSRGTAAPPRQPRGPCWPKCPKPPPSRPARAAAVGVFGARAPRRPGRGACRVVGKQVGLSGSIECFPAETLAIVLC